MMIAGIDHSMLYNQFGPSIPNTSRIELIRPLLDRMFAHRYAVATPAVTAGK